MEEVFELAISAVDVEPCGRQRGKSINLDEAVWIRECGCSALSKFSNDRKFRTAYLYVYLDTDCGPADKQMKCSGRGIWRIAYLNCYDILMI
jgi:hypothetical protein